jgi:hypothetical protein
MGSMSKIKRFFVWAHQFVVLFIGSALPAAAFDFGLEIRQSAEFTTIGESIGGSIGEWTGARDSGELRYAGSYSPWFSSELGPAAKLYLQAKVGTAYEAGEWRPADMPVLFEVGRSEVVWRPGNSGSALSALTVEAGRVPFQDPVGVIAAGLFDGFTGSAVVGQARVHAGALYTGLLYKETAGIVMTPSDAAAAIDTDTYFASRRVLFSAGAEFPALTAQSSLAANVFLQFDVNGLSGSRGSSGGTLHTQYLSAAYTHLALETLSLTGAVVLGLAENRDVSTSAAVSAQFAGTAGADWEVPGAPRDMLRGEIRWSTGAVSKTITAFTPVTSIPQGQVFSPTLSGLLTVTGKYITRFHNDFSASAEGTYFIRTDGGATQSGPGYPPSPGRLLGGEVYGALSWAPVSDARATVGGGFFFPGMGTVFASNAPVWWKVSAGVVLSL